jgi:ATP/maltotriose-dependent transcriptional regulator MalT
MKKRSFLSLAKVTRPTLSGVYPRERLFYLLDEKCIKPVIWVSGPPGCGKTTLISSYIDSRKLSCLWYQIDEDDKDIATFFYYMGLAAKKSSAKETQTLPHLTPEYLLGIPTFTRRYFQELYSRLNPPFVLVLDNYQEVDVESQLHNVIAGGLSEVPEGGSVIILSRGGPPSSLARLKVNEMMEIIGWDDLRLTQEETFGIASLRGKGNVSEAMLSDLHKKSDGWVGGLVLMLNMLGSGSVGETKSLVDSTPEEIFDYFTSELFEKTDRERKDFLLKTAFLSDIEPKIAEKLTGDKKSNKILLDLSKQNFFTYRRSRVNPAYQYHPLFREFLLSKAAEAFTPDEMTDLRKASAALLEDAGNVEEAAGLLIEAKEWERLSLLICKNAQTLLMQGRNKVIEAWLKSLPEDMLENNP